MNPAQNLSQEHHEFLMAHYTDDTKRALKPLYESVGNVEAMMELAWQAGYLTQEDLDRLTGHLADFTSDLDWLVQEHVQQSVDYVEQNG